MERINECAPQLVGGSFQRSLPKLTTLFRGAKKLFIHNHCLRADKHTYPPSINGYNRNNKINLFVSLVCAYTQSSF